MFHSTMEVIVGFGQIGQAVKEAICPDALVFDSSQPSYELIDGRSIGVMHICFPYSAKFVEYAQGYIDRWQPEHIAIWSTLPIGTTKKIKNAVHTPVTGKHPELAESIRRFCRWIGGNDSKEEAFFTGYFSERGLKYQTTGNSDYTEALKLLCTTEYGINIEFARYKKRVADAIGMPYGLTKLWNENYNELYRSLGMEWAQKYILDAPAGPKGGHCVTPNAKLLFEQYPDELVRIVGEIK